MSETLQMLLDKAESKIRLKGYHAVSFRDLADELGIKSSSVHYYFPQKHDLGIALVERYQKTFFHNLAEAVKAIDTPEEKLKAFCHIYKQALENDDKICLCGMLGAEVGGLPEELSNSVAEFLKSNVDWLVETLNPNLSQTVRLEEAQSIVSALQGGMMLSRSLKDNKILENVISDINKK